MDLENKKEENAVVVTAIGKWRRNYSNPDYESEDDLSAATVDMVARTNLLNATRREHMAWRAELLLCGGLDNFKRHAATAAHCHPPDRPEIPASELMLTWQLEQDVKARKRRFKDPIVRTDFLVFSKHTP
jgi:hypothetical protein